MRRTRGATTENFFLEQIAIGKMLETILAKPNMTNAYKRVVSNKGRAGIDGMEVNALKSYLNSAWVFLKTEILEGCYEPQAVKRVEIPKANGGKRGLGIPTVIDRMIQQAIAQILETIWEAKFHDNSYGFRPKRSAHQCVAQAKTYLNEGKTYIVDIDLEKFFDRVNHDYLMYLLSKEIGDKRVLSLIGKYLRAGILENGMIKAQEEGTPQGSPLSPILSNILLNELDWELRKRGLSFVRYADDFSIYVRSRKSALRVMSNIRTYIETKLHLKINETKSGVRRPNKMTILGFSFWKNKMGYQLSVAQSSKTRFKSKLKAKTSRRYPLNTKDRIAGLQPLVRGWLQYFRIADCKSFLKEIDEWLRSRLRLCEWKLWKRVRTRYRRLKELGMNDNQAYQWANTRKGLWRTVHSPILCRTLTNAWLQSHGYEPLVKIHKRIKVNV